MKKKKESTEEGGEDQVIKKVVGKDALYLNPRVRSRIGKNQNQQGRR